MRSSILWRNIVRSSTRPTSARVVAAVSVTKVRPSVLSKSFSPKTFFRDTAPKRSIVHTTQLKETYSHLKEAKKHLSPLNGATLNYSGALEDLHGKPSATCQLITELFNKQGSLFRNTQNKSNLGYSLTPKLIAKILHHLDQDTFDEPLIRDEICREWRRLHLEKTNSRKPIEKINLFLDLISCSKKECRNNAFPLHFTESILLSFLQFIAETRQDIIDYLQTLHALNPVLKKELSLIKKYSAAEIENLSKNLLLLQSVKLETKAIILSEDYESVMAAICLRSRSIPEVIMSRYGYQGKPARSNCAERSFHNLFNILLFNEMKKEFDFSLIPDTLKPRKELLDFYELQSKIGDVNSSEVGQAFMDMVSGISTLIYCQDNYEIETDPKNFLLLLNHLFSCKAESLAALSKEFSTEKRKISFKEGECKITIAIEVQDKPKEICTFVFTPELSELRADRFKMTDVLIDLMKTAYQTVTQFPLFLLAVYSPKDRKDVLRFLSRLANLTPQQKVEMAGHIRYYCERYNLLKDPTFLNFIGDFSDTALLQAAFDAGVDVNTKLYWNETLLHLNIGNIKLVAFLLDKGAEINATKYRNITPLHLAVGCKDTVALLLEKRANPNLCDRKGFSPLHYAVNAGKKDSVLLMVKAGADPMIKTEEGETAFDLTSDPDILEVLTEAQRSSEKTLRPR